MVAELGSGGEIVAVMQCSANVTHIKNLNATAFHLCIKSLVSVNFNLHHKIGPMAYLSLQHYYWTLQRTYRVT